MNKYNSIEEVESHFTPEHIKKYPIVLRIRVSEEEETTIMEWLKRRR